MRNKELFDDVTYQFFDLEPKTIMNINNRIANDLGFNIMHIFDNHDEDTVNIIFSGKTAVGVLRMAQADNSNYNIKHDFVRIDGHGNLKSAYACNIRTLTFEPELMVDWLIRHPEEAKEFGINVAIDKDNEPGAPGVFAGDLF